MVYKLQEYANRPRWKRSVEKETWPGIKQVFRTQDAQGHADRDLITLASENAPGEPLLREVMRNGRRVGNLPPLSVIRDYCRSQVAALPAALHALERSEPAYEVQLARSIRALSA